MASKGGAKFIPKWNSRKIVNDIIRREWFLFQNGALSIGKRMHNFIRRYINNNRKRTGGTGNLARSIDFQDLSSPGRISWGIGNIDKLQTSAPYWYVVNYGKKTKGGKFRPGGGKYIPGRYSDGYPDSSKRGQGKYRATSIRKRTNQKLPEFIRPMHYIEVTNVRLESQINRLLARLSKQ